MLTSIRLLLLTFGIFVFSPSQSFACNVCMREAFTHNQPYYPQIFLVLVFWRIVQLWIFSKHARYIGKTPPTSRFIAHLMIILFMAYYALDAGVCIYLAICFIYTSSQLMAQKIPRLRSKPSNILSKRWLKLMSYFQFVIFILILGLYFFGNNQYRGLSDFERYATYLSPSNPVGRVTFKKIGKDQTFQLDLLVPLLDSSSTNLHNKAFAILSAREKKQDLIELWPVLEKNGLLEKYLAIPKYSDPTFFSFWMSSLDVPDQIQSPEALKAWLEKEQNSGDNGA